MAGVNEYSSTPSSNTTVNGINIAEGCLPSTINNAIRQVMADVKSLPAVQSEASTHTLVAADLANFMRFTGTATANLTAAATLGANFWCVVKADGGVVTIDPDGSETIDGAATKVLADGSWAIIYCNATAWYSIGQDALDDDLSDIAALTPADDTMMVGDGTDWVAETGTTLRTSIGVGTGNSPQFTGVELGHATDTTLTRSAAGVVAVEGVDLLSVAGGQLTGTLKLDKGADVASDASLGVGSDGNSFDVTGTTTITSIDTVGLGTHITIHFDAVLTLTHHATDLVLPSGSDITTAAGDIAVFYEYASGDWRCVSYTKADGTAVVASAGGGPSIGDNAVIRTNAKNIISDVTLSDHSTAFDTSSTDTLNVGSDNGFSNEDEVYVTTTGTLPTGLAIETKYYVISVAAGTMQLSTTNGGSAASITHSSGSGTHTIYQAINGMSAGPITVETGHTVTVPYGSTWSVV